MTTKMIIDNEQSAAFIRRTGHINPGEMLEGTKDLESNSFFKNIRKSLSDSSAADFLDISSNEFESYALYCKTTLKDVKIAIVAPSDLSYGLARMFEILSNLENLLVTREMKEALSWLNVSLPENF